jgi:hypothetical protein
VTRDDITLIAESVLSALELAAQCQSDVSGTTLDMSYRYRTTDKQGAPIWKRRTRRLCVMAWYTRDTDSAVAHWWYSYYPRRTHYSHSRNETLITIESWLRETSPEEATHAER